MTGEAACDVLSCLRKIGFSTVPTGTLKVCPKCKNEFLDKRFTEVAIEGFDRRSVEPSFYLKGIVFFAVITLMSILLFIYMVKFIGKYPTKILGCIGIGILGIILCTLMFVRVKFGFEEKERENYIKQSEERLKNKEYAEKLKFYGYEVPDKYLN